MEQLELKTGEEIDIDGLIDYETRYGRIRYVGKAYELANGSWRCLADVRGMLCRVEVKITLGDSDGPQPAGDVLPTPEAEEEAEEEESPPKSS
jgi:hypothetical protein